MSQIEKVKKQVEHILAADNSGHGMDHIKRVLDLSLKFAEEEKADLELVSLIALLHDVDDYKLVGKKQAATLSNAKTILENCRYPKEIQDPVLDSLSKLGYSKSLQGIRPTLLEGKIVSDADMCDASGLNGILRAQKYSLKEGADFFDSSHLPSESISVEDYTTKTAESTVHHIFDKILKLKYCMLTTPGKKEGEIRHERVVRFLKDFFEEENAPEWSAYLDAYLKKQEKIHKK